MRTYWWHVRAVDGANIGPYSAAHAFELFTPVAVGVPQLRSPIGGGITNNRRPSFEADLPTITGPATRVTLEIEIARDPAFKELAARLTKSADGESVSVTPTQFAWDRTFYWRARVTARGREGDVVGDWSKTASFRTPAQPAPEPPPPPPAPTPSPIAKSVPTPTTTHGRRRRWRIPTGREPERAVHDERRQSAQHAPHRERGGAAVSERAAELLSEPRRQLGVHGSRRRAPAGHRRPLGLQLQAW